MVGRLVLEPVEVLAEQASGATLVERGRAGRPGQPPAGGLQVRVELGHQPERAADHPRNDTSAGHLRQERQVELTEHDPQGLVEVLLVGPGEGADAGGQRDFRGPRDVVRGIDTYAGRTGARRLEEKNVAG